MVVVGVGWGVGVGGGNDTGSENYLLHCQKMFASMFSSERLTVLLRPDKIFCPKRLEVRYHAYLTRW